MDVTTAQAHLNAWLAASLAAASGQSYSISTPQGYRTLTRADTAEIRKMINYWQRQVNQATDAAAGVKTSGFKIASWN